MGDEAEVTSIINGLLTGTSVSSSGDISLVCRSFHQLMVAAATAEERRYAWKALGISPEQNVQAVVALLPVGLGAAVAELCRQHVVKLCTLESALRVFVQEEKSALSQIFSSVLVELFPKQQGREWGWFRVGWSWAGWWQLVCRCLEVVSPEDAFEVLGIVLARWDSATT